jgi:hypothetical protein
MNRNETGSRTISDLALRARVDSQSFPPAEFVREHLDVTSSWEKVHLKPLRDQIAHFRDEAGFDQIARRLGVPPPTETFV